MVHNEELLAFSESLHLEVAICKGLPCTYFDCNLVTFLPGDFALCNEDLGSVLIFSTSIYVLTKSQSLGPLVVTLFVIIVVSEDSPLLLFFALIGFRFLSWRLRKLHRSLSSIRGCCILGLFNLICFQEVNCGLDSSFGFLVIVAICFFLELFDFILDFAIVSHFVFFWSHDLNKAITRLTGFNGLIKQAWANIVWFLNLKLGLRYWGQL